MTGRLTLVPSSDEARFMTGSVKAGASMAGTMIAGLNVSELLELALLLLAVGTLSGFLAGIFGIGGGAILVPVF